MNASKFLDEEEAFEVMPGCPTLTFVLEDEELAVPYQSFQSAVFRKDEIELTFSSGVLTIEGHCLSSLWRHFQLLDVRRIQCLKSHDPEEPSISSLCWEESSEED